MTAVLRPMRARDPHEGHRVATPLELFFDLVIVIAIASLTASFHHAISEGNGLERLANFTFLFLAVWWVWMNYTWFSSAFDNDDALTRFLTLVIMAGALMFAGGIGFIFKTMDFSYGLHGWIVMRVGMIALWLRAAAHNPDHRATCHRYAAGLMVAQAAWTLFYYITQPGSALFFALAVLVFITEWLVPVVAERAGRTPFHRHHIMERYGLLTIIVLGELLLSIGLTFGALFSGKLDLGLVAIAGSGLVIVFTYWWVYFAEAQHLTRDSFGHTFLWGYGHLFIFAGIALLGAGLAALFDVATDHSALTVSQSMVYVGGPLALAYLTLWLVRDQFMALGARLWALPTGAVLSLGLGLIGLPVVFFAGLAVAVLLWRVPFSTQKSEHHP